jgi:hypothetical protein
MFLYGNDAARPLLGEAAWQRIRSRQMPIRTRGRPNGSALTAEDARSQRTPQFAADASGSRSG